MTTRPLRILVLHRNDYVRRFALNLQVFPVYRPENFYYFHDIAAPQGRAFYETEWDAVILSYCAMSRRAAPDFERYRRKLAFLSDLDVPKIAYVQDDYIYYDVLDEWLAEMRVDQIYTPLDEHLDFLYSRNKDVPKKTVLTSYLDDKRFDYFLGMVKPFAKRSIDFGNRINILRPTYGRHGVLKGRVNEIVGMMASAEGLSTDISGKFSDRFFGDDWLRFLGDCRFTAAAKGGVSLPDPDGSVHRRVDAYLAKHPDAEYEEVEAACFPGEDQQRVFAAIGPRILQAGLMGVCQVLVEDEYPGDLEPWTHYIPIRRDMSNAAEVIEAMKDTEACARIGESAQKKMLSVPEFHFSDHIDGVMEDLSRIREEKSDGGYLPSPAVVLRFAESLNRNAEDIVASVSGLHALSPPLRAMMAKILAVPANSADLNRALSIIKALGESEDAPSRLSVSSNGFGLTGVSMAGQLMVYALMLSRDDAERDVLKNLIYKKLTGDLDTEAMGLWRNELYIHADKDYEVDLYWDASATPVDACDFLVGQKKHLSDHLKLKKNPLHLMHDLPKEGGYKKALKAGQKGLKVLFFTNDDFPGHPQYFQNAVKTHSAHRWHIWNPMRDRTMRGIDLNYFDIVLIDYSILPNLKNYMSEAVASAISRFRGPVGKICQDEYRWVKTVLMTFEGLNFDFIISSLGTENIIKVYGAEFLEDRLALQNMPGFLAEEVMAASPKPIMQRDILIAGRNWPRSNFKPQYGAFMHRKADIADAFLLACEARDLKHDISTDISARVYGADWGEFLARSRATIAIEGGSSMFDLEARFDAMSAAYLQQHPYADHDELYANVFEEYENNIVHKTITPRCLEAAYLKTAIIGYEGAYSGVLEPGRHYIVVKDDHSNVDEVLDLIQDDDAITELVERTYEEIGLDAQYSYKAHVKRLDDLFSALVRPAALKAGTTIFGSPKIDLAAE